MGKLCVDLKHKKLFVTMDKLNASLYQDVMQGDSHIRLRPDLNGRYSEALSIERDGGGAGYAGINFLGKAWAKKKGFKPNLVGDYWHWPSLNEIFSGLMMEATLKVKETSGCPVGSQMLQ
jgi:hypothetical protein